MSALAGLDRVDLSKLDLSRLSPADAKRAAELLRGLAGGASDLEAFIRRVTPHHPPERHMLPIIQRIARARLRPIRCCVSMPPRHGKSETLYNGLAWWMRDVPADTHAYLTYSDEQATSQSRKIRHRAQRGGVALSSEMANLSEWRTTSGGGLFAAGTAGALTGKGLTGLAVIDDPFKNREDADSSRRRDAVWEWFTSVVMTRLENASVIVVHTRWHEDDLIGRLAAGKYEDGPPWEIVNLPAIAGPDDPLGRAPGEALWPRRRSLSMLREQRAIDAFNFEALFQGSPRPRGATVFKEPTYYDPETFSLSGWRIIIYGDPAASKKTTANHSVILALAVQGYGAKMVGRVIDVYRKQVTIPEYVRDLQDFQARHGFAVANVESVAGFKAVAQVLREIDPAVNVNEVVPLGDKFQRAQPAASAWNGDPGDPNAIPPRPPLPVRIEVPLRAPWLKNFLSEMRAFTGVNDAADDQVDCLSGAWNEASKQIVYEGTDEPIMKWRR